ncbi:hypothetical protein Tco_1012182 [Tanacetum coccineum]
MRKLGCDTKKNNNNKLNFQPQYINTITLNSDRVYNLEAITNYEKGVYDDCVEIDVFVEIDIFSLHPRTSFYSTRSPSRRSAAKRNDKGKAIMKEAKPVQKKTKLQLEQERLGLEEALRLQEQLDEEERQRIARIAHRLQAQERERYSEADMARLLVELINERKRKFTQQRANQRRNKPMTQAQQRNYMCNYIKNMGSHTLQQLKKLSFDEVKELFETTIKRVNTFTPMESDDTVPKVVAGSSKIDAEQELNQESSKR